MPRFAYRPLGPASRWRLTSGWHLAFGWLAGLAAALLLAGIAGAQTPSSAEWALAPRGIFADVRVIHSMHIQMALDDVEATSGVALTYHDPMGNFGDPPPAGDELLLLMAAGVHDGDEPWVESARACRAWAEPGLEEVRDLLSGELARVWTELGVPVTPCEVVTDASEADLLVFTTPPASVDFAGHDPGGSFLASAPLPGLIPGGGTGGSVESHQPGGPLPAITGSLGPEGATDGTSALAGVLLVAALVGGARVASGRSRTGQPA